MLFVDEMDIPNASTLQDFRPSLWHAVISCVSHDGPHLVLTVKHVRRKALRLQGAVTFIGTTRIESRDIRNDDAMRYLEPGWEIDGLNYRPGLARLQVSRSHGRESFPVLHTIICDEVRLSLRLDLLRTLIALGHC